MFLKTCLATQSLRASLLVRPAGEAPFPVELAIQKPDRVWVKLGASVRRSNGHVVERIVPGINQKTEKSTIAAVNQLLFEDYLRSFQLFIAAKPEASFGIVAKPDEIRAGKVMKVFDLSPKPQGRTLRVVVDPTDWLPREVLIAADDGSITRVMIPNISGSADLSGVDFGVVTTPVIAGSEAERIQSISIDQLLTVIDSAYPAGTTLEVAGTFPDKLSKVRSAEVSLLVDGQVDGKTTITGPWRLRWAPRPSDSKSFHVQIVATQGSDRVVLLDRTVRIVYAWPLGVKVASIRSDGLAALELSEPLSPVFKRLELTYNGLPVKAWQEGNLLLVEGTRLVPGRAFLSGRIHREDGVNFPLPSTVLVVKPAVEAGSLDSSIEVTKTNELTAIPLSLTQQPEGAERFRVWLNEEVVAEGAGPQPIGPMMGAMSPGRNEIVIELIRSRTSFFSVPLETQATVTLDVQRRQVVDRLLAGFERPLRYRLAVWLRLTDRLPSELTHPDATYPKVREWLTGKSLMAENGEVKPLKLKLTPDLVFNDEAKRCETQLKETGEFLARLTEFMDTAHGGKKLVSTSATLESALEVMQRALTGAQSQHSQVAEMLEGVNAFLVSHSRTQATPFVRETAPFKAWGRASFSDHSGLIEACLKIVRSVTSYAGLENADRYLNQFGDAPFQKHLLKATQHLREVIRLKSQLDRVQEEIRLLERALERASSKEERDGIAKRIGEHRINEQRIYASIATERTRAWEAVETAGRSMNVDLSGAPEKAPKWPT